MHQGGTWFRRLRSSYTTSFERGSADSCSTLWELRTRPLQQWGPVVLPGKIFGNFVCQTVYSGEYLCDNWSTEWVNFALLNTGVEAFLNQLSY